MDLNDERLALHVRCRLLLLVECGTASFANVDGRDESPFSMLGESLFIRARVVVIVERACTVVSTAVAESTEASSLTEEVLVALSVTCSKAASTKRFNRGE
jgi:hypothetical protein